MRGRTAPGSVLVATAAAVFVVLAGGAGAASDQADRLRRENANLAARSRGAVQSLDSRLAHARAELATLHAEAARLEQERAELGLQVRVAQRVLTVSERHLAERLQDLYENGDVDPLAVILGARSLDDAVATIDDLSRTAQLNRDMISETRAARARLQALTRRLEARQEAVGRAAASAAETAAALAGARDARTAYIARLARQRRLNTREIATLERAAAAAQTKAAVLNAAQSVSPAAPAPSSQAPAAAPAAGGALTVTATGYSLAGHTATGVPAGWGVVAVDPSLIPLGTHLTIPGYGEGIAADTGSAVRGAVIDLWFPTLAQARAWGRRVVTITLH